MSRAHVLVIVLGITVVLSALPGGAQAQLVVTPLRPDLPAVAGDFSDASDPLASNAATVVVTRRDDVDPNAESIIAAGAYEVTRGAQSATVNWIIVAPDRITLSSTRGAVRYQFSQSTFLLVSIALAGPVSITTPSAPVDGCGGSVSVQGPPGLSGAGGWCPATRPP